jgi:hypothetical protein
MNKILLLVILGMVIFLLMNKQTCSRENFSNICWSLQSSYRDDILIQNKKLIVDLGLNENINEIIDPLVKSQTIDKKITLEKYLTDKKVPSNKLANGVKLINTILNNNCMISSLVEYDVKATTPLVNVVSAWHMDNLRNSMLCVINDKKVIDMLIKQLAFIILSPRVELCSKTKFQEYCEKSYENYVQQITPKVQVINNNKGQVINKKEIEKFAQELDNTKKDLQSGSSIQILNMESKLLPLVSNSPKYMDVNSLSTYLQTFNAKSLGNELEANMIKLMNIYKKNNKKDLKLVDKKEFGKFVGILVDEIKLTVKNIVDEDDLSKLKPLIIDFTNNQKIFYLLKHNYKLLLALELIDKNVKKDDEKLQAQLCCGKTGEKSCFNFSTNPKNPSAIVYGFNELGYVNKVKCLKDDDASKKLEKEQSLTLDQLFSDKYALWKNISKESKTTILANVVNLLAIHGIKVDKIDGVIGNIRKQLEDNKNKITMSDFDLTVGVKPGDINKQFIVNNDFYKGIVDQLKKADKIDQIQKIIKSIGFTSDQILFNHSVNLVYAKDITETLALVKEVMKNFGYDNNSVAVAKIFGIIGTSETFAEIMSKTTVLPRNHQLIIDFILKIITDKKFAIVRTHTMNSVPDTIIKYLQSKPADKDLNLCNVYNDFLAQLRKDQVISNNEFNQYDQQIELYCNPNVVNIPDIKSVKIPINDKKGLAVIEREHKSYNDFVKEHKEIEKYNLKSEVISDNILFNMMRNTYN